MHFLNEIRCALSTAICSTELRTCDDVVLGSDEEKALVKAIRDSFPNAGNVFCSLHIVHVILPVTPATPEEPGGGAEAASVDGDDSSPASEPEDDEEPEATVRGNSTAVPSS